ncbi:hypothetical protein Tco_1074671, partial [Tanacetum coccineum]
MLLIPRYEIRESSSAPTARPTGGFRADYDEIAKETLATDVAELSKRMTYFVNTIRQDTDEIYRRLDDAQDDRVARLSRQTWRQSMDASDTARFEMAALQRQQRPARDPTHPDKKIPPRKSPRTKTLPVTTTTTTTMTDEQLRALIAQGVTDVLEECEATRRKNGKDSHDSSQGVRRT